MRTDFEYKIATDCDTEPYYQPKPSSLIALTRASRRLATSSYPQPLSTSKNSVQGGTHFAGVRKTCPNYFDLFTRILKTGS